MFYFGKYVLVLYFPDGQNKIPLYNMRILVKAGAVRLFKEYKIMIKKEMIFFLFI